MVRNNYSNRFLDVASSSTTTTTTTTSTSTSTPAGTASAAVGHVSLSDPYSALINQTKLFISPLALSPSSPPQHHQQQSSYSSYREESTRVQLQRQRLREQHANALISNSIPGFKTSAAFFASLRTNLRLSASPPPSPMSTPPSMRGSTSSLPPPSPLAGAADTSLNTADEETSLTAEDPLAGIPELVTYKATEATDQQAGLKLVADSVAQQRQEANKILIWHPLNVATFVGIAAVLVQIMTRQLGKDWIAAMMSCVGAAMIYFTAARMLTRKYLEAAELINWAWLDDAEVTVTKFGDEIIGAIIVDWISGDGRQKRKKVVRGEIKGWAVRLKYRHKGVGTALLEDVVRDAKEKSVESLEFSEDHANSLQVLHDFFNKPFVRKEEQARAVLQGLYDSSPSRSKRK